METTAELHALQTRLAENLRQLREERGIQQERLAWEAGVDRSYYGRIERGIANPTLNVLLQLAQRLGVDVVRLLSDAEHTTAETMKYANDPQRGPTAIHEENRNGGYADPKPASVKRKNAK